MSLQGQILYHCSPVVIKEKGQWVVKAAGPTTSIREEPYQGTLIEKFRLRAVIGKGGMGPALDSTESEVPRDDRTVDP